MKSMRSFSICAAAAALILASSVTQATGTGTNIGVRLVGTAQAYPSTDIFDAYGISGPLSHCWDFSIVNIATGDIIGDVTDCGAIVGVVGDSLQVVGTTFFHFPGGTVATRVTTTVAPVTHGSPDFTHITGALPGAGEDNVIYGDGRFESATGSARLSGAIDLSTFFDDGIVSIDCVFVLDLKLDKH